MCQVFGGAEAEDPVDNEIGLYIQSLCEKNSLLMQYKNILEQVGILFFQFTSTFRMEWCEPMKSSVITLLISSARIILLLL